MASVPVTSSAILPPWITDISHAKLVQWKKERREYEDAISARCAISGEDKAKPMMTVKSTFDHQLLKMMCKYDWEIPLENVTEERILSEIDKIVNTVKNGDIDNIDALFDEKLRMDLREDDCTILKKHLRPRALREQVETHQKLIDKSSAKNDVALYKLVRKKALEQDAPWTSKRKAQQDAVAKGKPRGGCFKCGKDHWLSECPDIDEVEKEEIMAKRAPKKQNAKRFRVKRVNPLELDQPVELEAVGGAILTATHGADVYLCLNTAAGPVRCQDQKRCLIVESDDDEA
ncbi:uncharacterized protein PITG_20493 [Phytophthora infestans T30-4]|uniref:CCHC-type domain-containing protein n=1 Tax=Phytophthora infestans (strain T30-4) TaxID=403677 RepID=D0P2S4_PHYIT|nr:uncharacterized protein PITG_20493 [Phytophthora infestans T30-4]EEY57059.1 conserved hypothetical protein [Phytophthora infestans T30-4]|eukprot:XP_002895400.1 conserved hypothetical protein [Phytophthora infestans T30-4]